MVEYGTLRRASDMIRYGKTMLCSRMSRSLVIILPVAEKKGGGLESGGYVQEQILRSMPPEFYERIIGREKNNDDSSDELPDDMVDL